MTPTEFPSPAEIGFARDHGSAERHRAALKAAASAGDAGSLRKAAENFESQFISQMLGHMFKGIKSDGMFGGGQAESMWRDFYVEEVGKVIARNGGIGVADVVERQLIQLQEVSR